jgi:hypothetical protein
MIREPEDPLSFTVSHRPLPWTSPRGNGTPLALGPDSQSGTEGRGFCQDSRPQPRPTSGVGASWAPGANGSSALVSHGDEAMRLGPGTAGRAPARLQSTLLLSSGLAELHDHALAARCSLTHAGVSRRRGLSTRMRRIASSPTPEERSFATNVVKMYA